MTPFADVVHGAFLDGSFGTAQVGDTILAQLGGEWRGIRTLKTRFLLQWDLLASLETGWLGNEHPFLFLIGPHLLSSGELDLRLLPEEHWSPYVGVGLRGETSILESPSVSPDQLGTINQVDGVGGVVATGAIRLVVGASMLEERRSLLIYGFGEELLVGPQSVTPSRTFTAGGIGARFDVTRAVFATLEGSVGFSPNSYDLQLAFHDRTTRWGAAATVWKIFGKGMWIGLSASITESTDHKVYDAGLAYETSEAPTFRADLIFGLPLWRSRR